MNECHKFIIKLSFSLLVAAGSIFLTIWIHDFYFVGTENHFLRMSWAFWLSAGNRGKNVFSRLFEFSGNICTKNMWVEEGRHLSLGAASLIIFWTWKKYIFQAGKEFDPLLIFLPLASWMRICGEAVVRVWVQSASFLFTFSHSTSSSSHHDWVALSLLLLLPLFSLCPEQR